MFILLPALILVVTGALATGVPLWLYLGSKIDSLHELVEKTVAENARIKVSLAAGLASPEAKQRFMLTLAALNTEYTQLADSKPPLAIPVSA